MASFYVNGQLVTAEKNQKLLRFLRDELRLTSVKDGCSEGACGTCHVLIDGRATKACVPSTDKLEGHRIITVEGLSDREKEVYTWAFGKAGAVQCGFCIPGMVISAKALLDVNPEPSWRHDIASLNYILASNVWQQDHNGFTHQDPGFLDHVANKKADVVRMYLPPDANCLLSCFDHCIKSRNYVNVIVASKHPRPQWLTMDQAVKHCTQGIGIWDWASNDQGQEPDVVMACCGDTPTLETLAAVTILRHELPELKIRVINVVDLMKLQPHTEHPHGLTDEEYDMLFTKDKPIVFAYHGYPTLIHELTYRRTNKNLHVRGYKEEGTITTPFDMRVLNDIDRFDLVIDTVRRLPQLGNRGAYLVQKMNDKLVEHRQYIRDNGIDLPEVRNWKWEG